MSIKRFFKKAPNMSPEQLRSFMDEHAPASYTLLDVRQPQEYEKRHLAGATLIPLPELKDRISELEPEKPVVAY